VFYGSNNQTRREAKEASKIERDEETTRRKQIRTDSCRWAREACDGNLEEDLRDRATIRNQFSCRANAVVDVDGTDVLVLVLMLEFADAGTAVLGVLAAFAIDCAGACADGSDCFITRLVCFFLRPASKRKPRMATETRATPIA
jgi:hypothetical protein